MKITYRSTAVATFLAASLVSTLAQSVSQPTQTKGDDVTKMQKLKVTGNTDEGAAAAFETKADAETVTESVSKKDLNNPNAQSGSDLLKNTSGVTVNRAADGASKVSVRGLDQRLLRITVDGQRQGGTGNALDSIPPEIVQSLEVTKSFTPDMEADAVGGVINVNTGGNVAKTAFEQGRHQLTYNTLAPHLGSRNSFTTAQPFTFFSPKPNASIMATASFDDQYRVRERLSTLREWTPQISPGPAPYVGQSIPVLTLPLIESTQEHRERGGLVFNGDARWRDTSLYWRSNFSYDRTKRNRDYNDTDPSAGTPLSLTPTSGVFSGVNQSRRNQDQLTERGAGNFSFGARTIIGRISSDAILGFAVTNESEPHTRETVFLSDHTYRVAYDFSADPFFPRYAISDESISGDTSSINDPARYHFNYLSLTRLKNVDEEGSAKVNVKIDLADRPGVDDYVKFGGKFQQRRRKSDTDRLAYDPGTPRDMTGLIEHTTADLQTVDYHFGPAPSAEKVATLLPVQPSAFSENATETSINSNSGDYSILETVWALYGMGKVKFGRWSVIGGVRVEGTREKAGANQMLFTSGGVYQGVQHVDAVRTYVDALPGLHFRYDPTPGLLFRSSITRSLARPQYADLAPFRTLSFIDHRSRIGNPDLKPYQSTNLDWSLDKYSERWGLFSFSLFYKKIDHFIADQQYSTTIGNLGEFIEFKRINGDSARAMGAEANWTAPAWEWPSGLGKSTLVVNYSYTHGEAHYPTRPNETFPLPDQVTYQGSLSLHHERKHLSLDASLRYRSSWWEDLIAPGFDNYLHGSWDAEISGSYKVTKSTTLTLAANNVLNVATRHYAGTMAHMNDFMRSGVDFTAGVQWKL